VQCVVYSTPIEPLLFCTWFNLWVLNLFLLQSLANAIFIRSYRVLSKSIYFYLIMQSEFSIFFLLKFVVFNKDNALCVGGSRFRLQILLSFAKTNLLLFNYVTEVIYLFNCSLQFCKDNHLHVRVRMFQSWMGAFFRHLSWIAYISIFISRKYCSEIKNIVVCSLCMGDEPLLR
jgi:hypothetical protein